MVGFGIGTGIGRRTRVIACVSGKGGVGKTTIVSNLGLILNKLGKKTLVVDGNVTTPNLSLHLGIPLFPITLHDVLKGDAHIKEAIYIHPSGLKVVPGGIGIEDLEGINLEALPYHLENLKDEAEIILLDCAAGLGREALKVMEVADDVILVTNPDLPSVTDALKAKKLVEQFNTNLLGVVVNRVKGKKVELSEEDIENMLELPILAKIPEDPEVHKSIHLKTPIVEMAPNSPASLSLHQLGAKLIGKEIKLPSRNIFLRLMDWLRR